MCVSNIFKNYFHVLYPRTTRVFRIANCPGFAKYFLITLRKVDEVFIPISLFGNVVYVCGKHKRLRKVYMLLISLKLCVYTFTPIRFWLQILKPQNWHTKVKLDLIEKTKNNENFQIAFFCLGGWFTICALISPSASCMNCHATCRLMQFSRYHILYPTIYFKEFAKTLLEWFAIVEVN